MPFKLCDVRLFNTDGVDFLLFGYENVLIVVWLLNTSQYFHEGFLIFMLNTDDVDI